eukprot:355059-Chlamydomonas_euryale.AAC.5
MRVTTILLEAQGMSSIGLPINVIDAMSSMDGPAQDCPSVSSMNCHQWTVQHRTVQRCHRCNVINGQSSTGRSSGVIDATSAMAGPALTMCAIGDLACSRQTKGSVVVLA